LATALANKLARIAWSVLRNEKAFDTPRHEIIEPTSPSSPQRERIERIDERIKCLVTQMVARQPVR
jgi:hypothetical protein